ncbi:MAG: hypothetical protein KDJ88_12555 [Bauldia sp.]|nr:hypothetical protein [Bauldia sp.]
MRKSVQTFSACLVAAAFAVQSVVAFAADVPELANARKVSEDAKGDGTHTYYKSTTSPGDLVEAYKGELSSDGWSIVNAGGGGSSWGGGATLTATKGSTYLVLDAGGESGETHIDLCVWPSKPDDDDC